MRPARVNVFDGLRIATEHVEHLQDAMHSSIEDLREAAGLGRVIRGFDVQREGDASIVVGPGLAFDRHRRRLALDEPLRAEATLPPGLNVRYVCLKHERIEDGQVEGRAIMVWDSVSIVQRDSPPGPGDDVLPLVKLVRAPAGQTPSFAIVRLADTGPGDAAPAADGDKVPDPAAGSGEPPADDADPATGNGEPPAEDADPATGNGEPPAEDADPATGNGEPPAEDASVPEDSSGEGAPANKPAETPSSTPTDTPGSEAAGASESGAPGGAAPAGPASAAQPAAPPESPLLRVQQGVVRLPPPGTPPADGLSAIAAKLEERLKAPGEQGDLLVALSLTEVVLDAPPAAVTTTCQLAARVSAKDGTVTALESVGRGEATFGPGGATRFGLSTVRVVPATGDGEPTEAWIVTDVSENGVATLPLSPAVADAGARRALEELRVVVDLHAAAPAGIGISCSLQWSGRLDESSAAGLAQAIAGVSWSAVVGWKAVGG